MAEPLEPTRTRDAVVVERFGGELRTFRLTVPYLAKVQDDTGAGAGVVISALAACVQRLRQRKQFGDLAVLAAGIGELRVGYVTRPIFWGLVGGGMSANDAGVLIARFIDERGFIGVLEHALLAFQVITGAWEGPADDTPGEPGAAASAPPPNRS